MPRSADRPLSGFQPNKSIMLARNYNFIRNFCRSFLPTDLVLTIRSAVEQVQECFQHQVRFYKQDKAELIHVAKKNMKMIVEI